MSLQSLANQDQVPAFAEVSALHAELHRCGSEILSNKESGQLAEAQEPLKQLRSLRDRLVMQLKGLLQFTSAPNPATGTGA